jgi:hypothetical protein
MPWTVADVDRFKQGLTEAEKRRWVRIANSVLRRCLDNGGSQDECEASAIRQANGSVGNNQQVMDNLLYIQVNNRYSLRRVQHQGRQHLVAPVVMMVEGVHSGSHGAVLHLAEELGRIPGSWDGIPVTIGHPEDNNGQGISANSPTVIDREAVGRVYNTHMDGDKLKAEVWLDEQRLIAVAPNAYQAIEQGNILEVSVGVFTDQQVEEGEHQGEHYVAIARNHRPDHLAILPDERGACSTEDGCGIRLNQQGGKMNKKVQTLAVRNAARTPNYDGTSSGDWNAPDFSACVAGYYKHHTDVSEPDDGVNTVDEAPQAMKNWIASLSLLGNSGAETFEHLMYFPVVNPDTMELNENALRAVIGGRGAQAAIPDSTRNSARRKAYRLLNEEFDAGLEIPEDLQSLKERASVEGYAMTPLNNRTGYTELAHVIQRRLDSMDENGKLHYLQELYETDFIYRIEQRNDNAMYYRQRYTVPEEGAVDFVGDPTRVQRKVEYVEMVEQNKFKNQNSMANKKEGCCEEKVKQLIANERTKFTENHKEWLMEQSEEMLDTLFPEEPETNQNGDGGDDGKEGKTQTKSEPQVNGEQLAEALKEYAQTPEKFIELAPAEVQDQLKSGLNLHRQERNDMIKKIVNNAGENGFTEDELKQMSTDQLRKMTNMIPEPGNYTLNGGGSPRPSNNQERTPMMPGSTEPQLNQDDKTKKE